MSNLVTIYGGSGFLGRYVARRMAAQGWRVRVAVRKPNEAMHVRMAGAVGQVEPTFANIRDDESVRTAMEGADAVVNCVGTFDVRGRNDCTAVHADGAERIARLAAEAGISRLVHVSALCGSDTDSEYSRSKAEGEALVLSHMPSAMIVRPSVMFGTEDGFFNRFAGMARMGPVLPIVGGTTLFQPAHVDDVAAAIQSGVIGDISGTYELGGPEVKDLGGWIAEMLDVINRKRVVLNLPFFVGHMIALGLDVAQIISLGLFKNSILTRDQVKTLRTDNVVSGLENGFEDLGISPTAAGSVISEYLWRFRPSGQYDDIKASARKLKA